MRLKRIELAGFKSFVDPVKIDLSEGITAIVGPNGSGKSNIVDALRWVLGEHSARHLRGGVMDDLIFQGSETRPPVGICDVELTFALSKGRLSSPYHEMDEIRIRRRLTREGGSDAFINGRMVRIKDIVDLFLDTGLSSRAYAIIEQSAITRMISARPEDRRLLLEEAAGVMKYRSRRHESELKMKDTRQNLDRVMDLLEEVRSQCRSLKQQASRAGRFKSLQEEWQQTRAISMGIRYRQHQSRCLEEEKQLNQAKNEEAEIARQHAAAERGLAEARQRLLRYEEDAQGVQDALREAERKRSELQQQAERLAGERRLLAERGRALEHRVSEADSRRTHLQKELSDVETRISGQDDHVLQQALEQAISDQETAREQHEAQRLMRDGALAEFERVRSHHEGAEQRRKQAEASLERLREREALLHERREEISGQLERAHAALKRAGQESRACAQRGQQTEIALNVAHEQLDAMRGKRVEAEAELAARSGDMRRIQGEIQELQGRVSSRNVPDSLKNGLREAGVIWADEALQVPAGLEHAAAAALRGESASAQLPVNPGLASMAEQIGQARDLPVAFHCGLSETNIRGSLANAMRLDAAHPLYHIFACVLLVEDMMGAADALAAEPAAEAAVSRDGWRMEATGWLLPPAHKASARRLSDQRKLSERQRDLKRAEGALQACERRAMEAENALTQQQQAWQQAHIAATEAQSEIQAKCAETGRLEAEAGALSARLDRLNAETAELTQERAHWSSQISAGEVPDPARLSATQATLDMQNVAEAEARQRLDQMKNSRAAAEQALALHRQASENLAREKRRLHNESDQLLRQIRQDKEALSAIAEDIRRAEQHADMDQGLRQASEDVEHMHQKLNRVRQQGHALQQAAHEADGNERRIRTALAEAASQRQQREVALATETARLQDMEEEIRQRCQQTVESLMRKIDALEEDVDESAVLGRAAELEERLGRFGPVNLLAIEEYNQAAEREQFLSSQAKDLEASLATLTDTITSIDRNMRQRFSETFEQVNAYFRQTFPRLFGGGKAELRLDSDDLLSAGVEVIAQPPGKRLQDIELLSGGEKALTAVALVFSIFRIKPAPFCVLDEVDAPLDDANVGRFGELVEEFSHDVQFLNITHNKVSMQMASRIIGVSMPEAGVSRIVGVDLENVEKQVAAIA